MASNRDSSAGGSTQWIILPIGGSWSAVCDPSNRWVPAGCRSASTGALEAGWRGEPGPLSADRDRWPTSVWRRQGRRGWLRWSAPAASCCPANPELPPCLSIQMSGQSTVSELKIVEAYRPFRRDGPFRWGCERRAAEWRCARSPEQGRRRWRGGRRWRPQYRAWWPACRWRRVCLPNRSPGAAKSRAAWWNAPDPRSPSSRSHCPECGAWRHLKMAINASWLTIADDIVKASCWIIIYCWRIRGPSSSARGPRRPF